jgi:phenylalanyl-tRNA synthetase beta chain
LGYTAKLLQTYTDATFTSHQSYHTKPINNEILFDINWANSYLGTDLSPEAMTGHLKQLGMKVNQSSDSIQVTPPSYRYDIQLAHDLVEEVARLYGYNNIPLEPMHGRMTPKLLVTPISESAKTFIVHHGYHEVVQFSFVPKSLIELFPNECEAIEISNPINSEFSYMRTNVLQSLVMAAQHNYQRQMKQFKLFEVGQSFQLINSQIHEQTQLAAICVGNSTKGYGNRVCTVDYYDMQSLALGLLAKHGMESITVADSRHPALHPKQSCRLLYQGNVVGEVGVLHPATSKALSLPEAALLILYLDQMDTLSGQPKTIKPTSKYPSITRDITFTVSSNTMTSDISEVLVQAQIPHLIKMSVVDVYTPDSELESKRITWSLSFQSHDKTLTDKEIEAAMQVVRKEAVRFTQAHK